MPSTVAYSGYHNRPKHEHDTYLTDVGPDAPCGDYLRRYWPPFMLASQLGDLPVAVRLLGEDLVAFRDGAGELGLLHRHCIHRGTSLEFGIIAEHGIRCCYHGWHFAVDGSILDTPGEGANVRIKDRHCQGAYRIHAAYGLLFAYMGPPQETPDFPLYDCFSHPHDNALVPFNMRLPCSWLQIIVNGADPIHNAFLHAIVSGQQFSPAFKVLPVLDFPQTRLILANLDAILAEQELTRGNVVSVQVQLTQFARFHQRMLGAFAGHFAADVNLAFSCVGVTALPRDALVQMEIMIARPADAATLP